MLARFFTPRRDHDRLKEIIEMAVIQGIADALPAIQAAVAAAADSAGLQAKLDAANAQVADLQAQLGAAQGQVSAQAQDEADSVAAVQAALVPPAQG